MGSDARHLSPSYPAKAGYPVRRGFSIPSLSRVMTAIWERSGYAAGTGSAVTDLIFSIAKRDVTFFSGTAPISFL
jgi:hypothetical protein